MKIKDIIPIINLLGILYLIFFFVYGEKKVYTTEKTIEKISTQYVGDTNITYNNYNTYQNHIVNNYDTNIVVYNYTTNEYGDTIDTSVTVKAHKYVSVYNDDTIKGNITTLTDGNIFDVKLKYSLNKKLFNDNPFEIYMGTDISLNMFQPNISFGKRVKYKVGYDLLNKNLVFGAKFRILKK